MDDSGSDGTPQDGCPPVLEGVGWFILFGLCGFLFFYFKQTRQLTDTEFGYIFWTSIVGSIILTVLRRKLEDARNAPLNGPLDDRLNYAEKAIEEAAREVLERETREAFRAAGRFLKRARGLRHEEWFRASDNALFEGPHVTSNGKLIVPTTDGIEVVELKEDSETKK